MCKSNSGAALDAASLVSKSLNDNFLENDPAALLVSKSLNEIFFKSEPERPTWMHSFEVEGSGNNVSADEKRLDEEKLLDDAHARYICRTWSIESSRSYSRTCSLESQEMEAEESEVILRVAMCCGSCENKVKSLTQMEGVTSVVCDRKTEKVTVTGTAHPRVILEECRKLFEQSKIWTEEEGDFHEAAYGNIAVKLLD